MLIIYFVHEIKYSFSTKRGIGFHSDWALCRGRREATATSNVLCLKTKPPSYDDPYESGVSVELFIA
ncbi:hypothetical protein LAV73_00160 [Lysinibacillus xylanilyticus]|uniref:hypothetical protein n=1 Tax=Lysinibacillus xylanilyticus TaxID=582475 RepID=UPI002B24FD07|nr:hypothetical protein [Lysinibacillus xylanilyticus]MEB2278417.1 hypothetical protein [Lysinibacillus xylanilyticus]